MDWLIEYGKQIVTLVTVALVAGVWGYVRYWRDRDRLRLDLEGLVRDGLEYLKGWAKERLDAVTTEDIAAVANQLYDQFVEGTALAKLVTREEVYVLLREAFVHWRERFDGMNQAMAVYATRVRREGW